MKYETHRARVVEFCTVTATKGMKVGDEKTALLQLSSLRPGTYTWECEESEKEFKCVVSIPEWATRANEHVQGRRELTVTRLA